jgi:multidrug resistance efflux pump
MLRRFALPGLAVALLLFSIFHVVRAQHKPPQLEPPVAPARNPYGATVAGAGIVEASTENIAVGSALPGIVVETHVSVDDVGKKVKAGEPLFRVDDRQLKAQLAYQEASLQAAEAQLAKLEAQPRPEEVPPSEAKVRVAEAAVAVQKDLAERAQRLVASRAMADEDVRQRQLALDVARQQLSQAKADDALLKAGAWAPDKAIARAAVAQARAQIEQTRTELERSVVRAPVDGEVLQVNVRLGEFVGASPNQTLLMIGNVHKLHVRVDVDEHDIPRFRPGAPARASVRGHPGVQFPLRFVRVEPYVVPKKSLTGDNTERVDTRVLQVIYAVESKEMPLYVGQQMDVFIEADNKAVSAGAYP